MLRVDVQLAAAHAEECAVRQLLPVQLHLDEVVLSDVGVLDAHLQDEFWEETASLRLRECLYI